MLYLEGVPHRSARMSVLVLPQEGCKPLQRANLLVAEHLAQDAVVPLAGVDVDRKRPRSNALPPRVLPGRVVDGVVAVAVLTQLAVAGPFISEKERARWNIAEDVSAEDTGASVWDDVELHRTSRSIRY